MAELIIVTYHSLDFGSGSLSRHAVSGEEFEAHLDAIARHHHLLGADELRAIRGCEELGAYLAEQTRNCWLLTFDDGYSEHFEAAERLQRRGAAGIFFVAAQTMRGTPLLANKIHLLDAKLGGLAPLAEAIGAELGRPVLDELLTSGAQLSRSVRKAAFDSQLDRHIKIALQELDPQSDICLAIDRLVHARCGTGAFEHVYATQDDLKRIADGGSLIGGHGETHRRLARIAPDDCAREAAVSRTLVEGFHPEGPFHFAHPYGNASELSIGALAEAGFRFLHTIDEGRNASGAIACNALRRIDAKRVDAFV